MRFKILLSKNGKSFEAFAEDAEHAEQRCRELEASGYVVVSCLPIEKVTRKY